jgi:hypothetical protein
VVARATDRFAWLASGEVEVFGSEELARAKVWVAG